MPTETGDVAGLAGSPIRRTLGCLMVVRRLFIMRENSVIRTVGRFSEFSVLPAERRICLWT